MRHRDDCTAPAPRSWQGRHGDPMQTCTTCGAVSRLGGRSEHPPEPTPTPVAAVRAVAAVVAPASYRCREHGCPVSWRGTGCPECELDRKSWLEARRDLRVRRHQAALRRLGKRGAGHG